MSHPEKDNERQTVHGTFSVRHMLNSFTSMFSSFGSSSGRTQLEAIVPDPKPVILPQSPPSSTTVASTTDVVGSSVVIASLETSNPNISGEIASIGRRKRRKHGNDKPALSSSEDTDKNSSGLFDRGRAQECDRKCEAISEFLHSSGIRVFCIVHDGNLKEVILRIERGNITWSLKGSTQALAVPIGKVEAIENGLPPKLSALGWEAVQTRIFYIRIQGGKCVTFIADSPREQTHFVLALRNVVIQQAG